MQRPVRLAEPAVRTDVRPSLPLLLLLLAALLALPLQGLFFPDCLSDDAFISFRYARHLTQGHGLVFNPGETQPVEGYTNFLWTLLLAATTGAGLDAELAARRLGLLCGLATLLASWLLCRRLAPASPWVWPLPAVWLVSCSFFVVEALQGLETMLMALLVTLTLALRVAELNPPPGSRSSVPWSALTAGLAAITRPEGYMVFGVLLLHQGLRLLARRRRPDIRDAWLPALFALPVVPQLLYRLATYGQWLPHTFHAKTGGGLDQLQRGLHYVGDGGLRLLPWLVLAALLLRPSRKALGPVGGTGLVFTVWLAAVAGVAAVGGDFKPTFRFLVWSMPLLATLAAVGIAGLAASGAGSRRFGMTALVAVLVAVTLSWTWGASFQARHFATVRQADLLRLRQAAAWFDDNLPADALIATGPAGAIPYYTGRRTLDMWGINDALIGRRAMPAMGSGPAGHEKGDGASVLARRPDVILFTEARFSSRPVPEDWLAQGYLYVSERELLELPEFHTSYRWRSVPLASAMLNFYQRKEGDRTP